MRPVFGDETYPRQTAEEKWTVHRFVVVGALTVRALVLGACADDEASDAATPQARPDIVVTGTDQLTFEPDAFEGVCR